MEGGGSNSSLYNLAIGAVIANFERLSPGLLTCPENILFDVFHSMYLGSLHGLLARQLPHLPTFHRLLLPGARRTALHRMVQAAVEVDASIPARLAQAYSSSTSSPSSSSSTTLARQLESGLSLGGFLCEAGWYPAATSVHRAALRLLPARPTGAAEAWALEARAKLLHSLTAYCCLPEASALAGKLQASLQAASPDPRPNLATVYTELSAHSYMVSQYQDAFHWGVKAVEALTAASRPKLTIDVLRQASKACVVMREFSKAELLVKQAVGLAKMVYGTKHPKYADCLIDYGFYLLNVDCITSSMQVYQTALEVRLECFGRENLQVAEAHEDLAYATYVHEYNTGKFGLAKMHANAALAILTKHLPKKHLMLASSKRVLALILEEIAIDAQGMPQESHLLRKAEELHLFALDLAIRSFGERNVQTAKHYGNLGRLYQTMRRFRKAETMHKKAIAIKESLLGLEDYEVALSLGHLASLYNYDLEQYSRAEELYLRSVRIGRQLFGPSYSGLEYDYRGLIQVYQLTADMDKVDEFTTELQEWRRLRDEKEEVEDEVVVSEDNQMSLVELVGAVGGTSTSSRRG